MKILFLNYEYPPLGGGAANATKYLLEEFARSEALTVDLVTSSVDHEYHVEQLSQGRITIHRVPIGKNAGNIHYQSVSEVWRYFHRGLRYALKLSAQESYDVTCAFFTVPSGLMARLLKWRLGIPYVVSLRGSDVPGYSERFAAMYALSRPLVRHIWAQAGAVVANSNGLRTLALRTDPACSITVIENGVATTEYGPLPAFSGEGQPLRLLCVSRLTPRKGIRYLIEAVALLVKQRGPGAVHLTLIGDGHERPELEARVRRLAVEGQVAFTGPLPHELLPERYKAADVFVLPSLNEGMSNTMLEALASGLPIVATDTGGTEELLIDGKNGFQIPMRSPTGIATAVGHFLDDRGLLSQMGASSRVRAETMSWHAVAEKYRHLMEGMVKKQ